MKPLTTLLVVACTAMATVSLNAQSSLIRDALDRMGCDRSKLEDIGMVYGLDPATLTPGNYWVADQQLAQLGFTPRLSQRLPLPGIREHSSPVDPYYAAGQIQDLVWNFNPSYYNNYVRPTALGGTYFVSTETAKEVSSQLLVELETEMKSKDANATLSADVKANIRASLEKALNSTYVAKLHYVTFNALDKHIDTTQYIRSITGRSWICGVSGYIFQLDKMTSDLITEADVRTIIELAASGMPPTNPGAFADISAKLSSSWTKTLKKTVKKRTEAAGAPYFKPCFWLLYKPL